MLCLVSYTAQHCEENKAVYTWLDEAGFWLVGYNEFPCKENHFFSSFCENSGWGNEEATVMCRELGYSYGVGSKCTLYSIPQTLR